MLCYLAKKRFLRFLRYAVFLLDAPENERVFDKKRLLLYILFGNYSD
jgi:hypothetical protein